MTSGETFHNGSKSNQLNLPFSTLPRISSRSPHPYHRRSTSLHNASEDTGQAQAQPEASSDSTESEERATEADDEKGPILLKSLPAPPLRGRKGLKGSKTPADVTPAISPLPTPPAALNGRLSYFPTPKLKKGAKVESDAQKDAAEAYRKYQQRRRAEVARRLTEMTLLALIGLVACKDAFHAGRLQTWSRQLYGSVGVVCLLCVALPLRLTLRRRRSGQSLQVAAKAGFHIPSRFDPGALLYPVFMPFLISAALPWTSVPVELPNLILGLCSLPSRLVPRASLPVAGYVHWAITLTPLLSPMPVSAVQNEEWGLGPNNLALFFPLHQALLATLKYLTATSLDPAEIQLLATGLINLYFFANSPQSHILKSLLWVGAMWLFILCQKALSWEVAIARVPAWKFARNKSPKAGILGFVEQIVTMFLPKHRYRQSGYLSPDDEDYEHLKSARRMVKTQVRLRKTRSAGMQSDTEPPLNGDDKTGPETKKNGLQRSATLSANHVTTSTSTRKRRHSLSTSGSGLLSLTYAQAQACKWIISIYVFAVVAFVILLVVRRYVSTKALSSYEPFGWAVGYLFGNIAPLRLWLVSNNLEKWVPLPQHAAQKTFVRDAGWMEQMRQRQIGSATTRLALIGYCLLILTTGIGTVLRLGTVVEVDTRRKVFHGIMVAMLLPAVFIDPCFVALALSLILAIFLLLDLFRASQLPPVSKPLTTFLAPYVDGRDYRGPVIVSPIFLLVGCAIPLWLSLAGTARTGDEPWVGWDTETRDLSMISGVVCVGMGDAAASLVGRRFGKTKWFWGGGKSLEGSFAFAAAVSTGLSMCYAWLRVGGWAAWDVRALPVAFLKTVVAGTGASVLESVLTAGNDNVIVPVGLWLLVRGLRI